MVFLSQIELRLTPLSSRLCCVCLLLFRQPIACFDIAQCCYTTILHAFSEVFKAGETNQRTGVLSASCLSAFNAQLAASAQLHCADGHSLQLRRLRERLHLAASAHCFRALHPRQQHDTSSSINGRRQSFKGWPAIDWTALRSRQTMLPLSRTASNRMMMMRASAKLSPASLLANSSCGDSRSC